MTDEEMAGIRALLESIEGARANLTNLGGPEWSARRPRAPLVEAAHALLAEVEQQRQQYETLVQGSTLVADGARLSFEALRQRLERAEARIEALKSENTNLRELNDAQLFAAAASNMELQARITAMREIVEAVAHGDMTAAQEDLGTTPICVFGCGGHEDPDAIGKFIHTAECQWTKARALLGLETE